MMAPKKVVINADDLGLHGAVDWGVAELASRGIVTAASVMVLGAPDVDALGRIRRAGIDLGLHLDLTSVMAHARYGNAATVRTLIAACWARMLDARTVRTAVQDQLDRFEQSMQREPRFVDGHEHVHQFPMIRDALLDALAQRYGGRMPAVRDTRPRRWRGAKAATIGWLGAAAFAQRATELGCAMNADFAGIYAFGTSIDLAAAWRRWLDSMPAHGGLIMCHPAVAHANPNDAIAADRAKELEWLLSDAFSALLRESAAAPSRWNACSNA